MTKISIIIPVYNVEKYLKQCLDNVVNQTLKDIEIICIDDCSSDNSLNILKEYAKNDNRIKIIEQKVNQGQGVARNEAIKIAEGEYIGFVDPDDWIELDMYEKMYNKSKEFGTDITLCNFERYYNNLKVSKIINPISKCSEVDNSIITNKVFNFRNLEDSFLSITYNYAWIGIYKHEFVKMNNLKFAEMKIGEDRLFCCLAKFLANKIVHIDRTFYHYRIHRNIQYPINKFHDLMYTELLNEFYKYNPSNKLKTGLVKYLTNLLMGEYVKKGYSKKEKRILFDSFKNFASYNSLKLLKKYILIYKIKNFYKSILSTKNIEKDGYIYKYLNLLGIKINLGVHKPKTLVAVERERERVISLTAYKLNKLEKVA